MTSKDQPAHIDTFLFITYGKKTWRQLSKNFGSWNILVLQAFSTDNYKYYILFVYEKIKDRNYYLPDPKEELRLKVSFLTCQWVNMNPNFKILLSYRSTFKFKFSCMHCRVMTRKKGLSNFIYLGESGSIRDPLSCFLY